MIVPFGSVVALAGVLFVVGVSCAMTRRSLIMILLGVEIMLNAAAILFVGASLQWHDMEGQTVVLFIAAVAATEVSVGLAMIVHLFRRRGSFDPSVLNLLR